MHAMLRGLAARPEEPRERSAIYRRPVADPSSFDPASVIATLLSALAAGADERELTSLIEPFHPRRNTFPAEVLFEVAVAALDEAGASREHPLDLEPAFVEQRKKPGFGRQREQERLRLALHAPAAMRGGLELDLLSETYWWQSDDVWHYALVACLLYIEATAERAAVTVPEMCDRLGSRLGVTLTNCD